VNIMAGLIRRRPITAAVVVIVLAAVVAAVIPPRGPRSLRAFDPHRAAELETSMWQAYYEKQNVRLFALLVEMLHDQYHYSWAKALHAGFHLARAAATFGRVRSDYEQVLPDLERAYAIARDWTSAGFDPPAVARAELAWWVARREPASSAPAHVGDLIAVEYALLYEVAPDAVRESGRLRAEAAALRDREAERPDWPTIGARLDRSYVSLHNAIAAR
jgi:hypothetical protein